MVRRIALKIWKEYLQKGTFLSRTMEKEFQRAELDRRDKAFIMELVYGACRRKLLIDSVLKKFVRKTKASSYPFLSLGIYQILYMRSVTDYAAVSEMVEEAKRAGLKKEQGFINAVLRRVSERKDELMCPLDERERQNEKTLSVRLSYPLWMVRRFSAEYGLDKACAVLEAMNTPSPVPIEFVREKDDSTLVMSPAQKKAVFALDVTPGMHVLDLCSSPGGKAKIIAGLLKGEGKLVCVEKNLKKLARQKESMKESSLFSFICGDAGKTHELFSSEAFDRIMLDVPCSNTGEMSRRPEVRWRLKKNDAKRLSHIQKDLLKSASEVLKAGGVLVYSTCSLMQEENEDAVRKFLEKNPQFYLIKEETTLPICERPYGGYYAKIIKDERL
ncbi:MAG: hypothetical protein JW928_09610 [Candidatus Aureabacteria bacterium]|nr:hypothetical protein [Candidatus Auribacterota bacterium]